MSDKKSNDKNKPREGQENSSILHDDKNKEDLPVPLKSKDEGPYKQQDEYVQKSASHKDEDED